MKEIGFIPPELRRLDSSAAEVLALFRFDELRPFRSAGSFADWRLYGHLSRLAIQGFLSGIEGEAFLMPLGRHLGPDKLVVIGLGRREQFGEVVFKSGVEKMLDTVKRLGVEHVACTLPGRPEGVCETAPAIEWFLSCLSHRADELTTVKIIEPIGPQKAMIPLIERWRLRQLIPAS